MWAAEDTFIVSGNSRQAQLKLCANGMKNRAILVEPTFRPLHIIKDAIADSPKGGAVIGFNHMSAFMRGDIFQHFWRGTDQTPRVGNMPELPKEDPSLGPDTQLQEAR